MFCYPTGVAKSYTRSASRALLSMSCDPEAEQQMSKFRSGDGDRSAQPVRQPNDPCRKTIFGESATQTRHVLVRLFGRAAKSTQDALYQLFCLGVVDITR